MIIRVVKMTFRAEEVGRFQQLFDEWKHQIRASKGCRHLELLHDVADPRIFFTYSLWDDAFDLDTYRDSTVFGAVWPVVKDMFYSPPEAWTLDREHMLP